MLTISQAAPNASYYGDKNNYYSADAEGPSAWFGEGAEALGLSGPVSDAVYGQLYEGKLPNGVELGRMVHGEHQHRTPRDLTFSVPKSVSIMALAGGDRRLTTAVQEAAREALAWMEKNAAHSRITEDGKTVSQSTGNLVAAVYLHELTREQEPGLHVHAVVMNTTRGPDGKWRSLDNPHLYWNAKDGGLQFQSILALKVRELGYDIVPDRNQGTFELAGFTRELIEDFSTRRKQIAEHLAAKGKDLKSATPKERHDSALETRASKPKTVDRPALNARWQSVLAEHGMDLQASRALADARSGNSAYRDEIGARMQADALDAVRTAARILAEKRTVFADVDLLKESERHAFGRVGRDGIRAAIRQLDREGFLEAKEVRHYEHRVAGEHIRVQGWTTAEAIAIEEDILRSERQGRQTEAPLLPETSAHRFAASIGEQRPQWSEDHQKALFGLLTSQDRVVALDAPRSSESAMYFVARYLYHAERWGMDIRAMAPSAVGAAVLDDHLRKPAVTVASHLAGLDRKERSASAGSRQQLWLVSDAGGLGTELARNLLTAAEKHRARVVLMDQGHQAERFGGKVYRMLREAGMTSFQLPAQKGLEANELHLALAALSRSDARTALWHIKKSGGRIISLAAASRSIDDQKAAQQQRRDYIAAHYAGLPPDEQARTRVLEVTRRDKEATSEAIRQRLVDQGVITGPRIMADVLIAKPLSKTERMQAVSYEPDDIVRFGRSFNPKGKVEIARGEYLRVRHVGIFGQTVMLEKDDGRQVKWRPARWGAETTSTYRLAERELGVGERIVWTRKDETLGVVNQQRDVVAMVDEEHRTITVERNGTFTTIDLTAPRHVDHDYAALVRSRAMQPEQRIIAHLPADNAEMTTLRSLVDVTLQTQNELTIVTQNAVWLSQAVTDRSGQEPAAAEGVRDVPGPALDAVRTAADMLAERNAVFSHKELVDTATKQGLGFAGQGAIEQAIGAVAATGQLISREAEVFDPESRTFRPGKGWTTLEAVKHERTMIEAEREMRTLDRPILSEREARRVVARLAEQSPEGKTWNADQRTAAMGLLSSSHGVTGLQGLAGTAKTSSVLHAVAGAARGAGYDVHAMAPTTDAALTLGRALDVDGKTVARHLGQTKNIGRKNPGMPQVWLVDEASMIGSKDMRDLIRAAAQHQAKLFHVFDVLQLGSVNAGRAAGQLIEHGMKTFYLADIVRQAGNAPMRAAVYDMIARQPEQALRNVMLAGGMIVELDEEKERIEAIAKEFAQRSPAYREETLVIDPTRKGVEALSKAIRAELEQDGTLRGPAVTAPMLEDASLTEAERATSTSYKEGQIVQFMQRAALPGQPEIERGAYVTVAGVDGAAVLLEKNSRETIRWEPKAERFRVAVFDLEERELQAGDKIRWTQNNSDIGAVSGRFASVVGVDPKTGRINVKQADGGTHQLDLTKREHQRFSYGYAVTTYRAQGATADPIIHARSTGANTVHDTFGYVVSSRTTDTVLIFTDDRKALTKALGERSGQQEAGLDQARQTAGLAEKMVRDMAATKAVEHQRTMEQQAVQPERAPTIVLDRSGPVLEL